LVSCLDNLLNASKALEEAAPVAPAYTVSTGKLATGGLVENLWEVQVLDIPVTGRVNIQSRYNITLLIKFRADPQKSIT